MSVLARSVGNAFRNKVRTAAVVAVLAVAIGLALAMLVANQAVTGKVAELNASVGTVLTVNPAGGQGFEGGGEPLTAAQAATAAAVPNVSSVVGTKALRLRNAADIAAEAASGRTGPGGPGGQSATSVTTSLTAAVDAGTLGNRNQASTGATEQHLAPQHRAAAPAFSLPITATGIGAEVDSTGKALQLTQGTGLGNYTAASTGALLGTTLATKNGLKRGLDVHHRGHRLHRPGAVRRRDRVRQQCPLRDAADRPDPRRAPGELSTMIVTVNSMENVDAAKTALQAALGSDKADVTQGQRNLETAVSSLDSVKNISFIAFVAALGTAGLIILLIMVMLVRERRREIGVLKAIGAPNRTIGLQFVLEALVLVAMGSVVGAAVASLASGGIASALISSSSSTARGHRRGAGGAAASPGGVPGAGRTVRRGQPAADLRDGERLPRRHRRGHRRGFRRRHHRRARPGPAHRPHPSHRSPPRRIAMIEVKNLVRTFKSGDRTIKPVNDVSFELEQGTLASIVGKSGSGKSTLLSLLGALDKPTSGDVVVNGVSLASMPDGKLTNYRRRDIGFVFQQFNLIPNLSAVDNVMLPMEFAGVRKAARAERARQLLEQVQLDPDKHGGASTGSPAASSSGWRSPGRWPTSPS